MTRSRRVEDEHFMRECLIMAVKGAGYVSPNPMVGAVVVRNGKIVGKGYHQKFGGPHAEVHAIRQAGKSVRGSTLYVNLEPCNFFGKTPPCTDLIIDAKISRVVVGVRDPNPRVSGKGVSSLRRAGIPTTVGVLQEECSRLNEVFFKFIVTGLPFVTLKIAQTLDGKIARVDGSSKWITGPEARRSVHAMRATYDAVLVGAGTVLQDNPRLTVRSVRGRNPARIVLDGRMRCDPAAKVFSNAARSRTLLITSMSSLLSKHGKLERFARKGVVVVGIQADPKGMFSLATLLRHLASMGIGSLLVEGGASVFSGFMEQSLADKLVAFVAPRIFGGGLDAFAQLPVNTTLRTSSISVVQVGSDVAVTAYLHKS